MDKKQDIITRATVLFKRFGVRSVSMDNISSEMGMSKKTLYEFFTDKRDLLHVCIKDMLSQHKLSCNAIVAKEDNFISRFYMLSQAGIEQISSINPSLLFDLQKYHRKSWNEFASFKEEHLFQTIVEQLNLGKDDGLVRKNVNAEIAAKLHISLIDAIMNPANFDPDKFEIKLVIKQHVDTFLRGICTKKGNMELEKIKSRNHA